MHQIKNHIKTGFSKILFVIIFSFPFSFAQTKTNLQVFYDLVDSSVSKINTEVSTSDLKVDFSTGKYFGIFQNQVISDFTKLGRTVISGVPKDSSSVTVINYSIDNASVKYGEMERDGFLGAFIMPREIGLSGSYSLGNKIINAESFNLMYYDTLAVDDVRVIENPSFPFTQGEVPSEPFFSSLFEPVVAIGSAAIAVILFFTIRSK